jgi:hypothetical protein
MNERIKQLSNEAGLLVYNPNGVPTKLEKFAELIIRECADFVAAGEFGDPGMAHELIKYFGVE